MNEDELVWPVVLLIGFFLLYKMTQNSAAAAIAQANSAASIAASNNNNPWLNASLGVGAAGGLISQFSNLFESSD